MTMNCPGLSTFDASTLAAMIRSGKISAGEVLEDALARIGRFNPHLNALVTVDAAGARAMACRVDQDRREGRPLPPLAGVPLSIKDAFATRGLRTTASHRPLADYLPDRDATVVARLRAAGGVIVGKSNLPELAGAPHCWSPLFGLTRNPWDPELTPGGSSGGAAVAVAAGFSLLDAGSDLAGSIRIPAAYCGVAGFKATENRIPRTGHIPHLPVRFGGARSVRHMLSLGVLARSVADLRLGYALLAGPDGEDMEVPPLASAKPGAPLPEKPLRLALWTDLGLPLCPRTRAAMDALPAVLRAAGHELCCTAPPGLDPEALREIFGLVGGAEIGLGLPAWQRALVLAAGPLLPATGRMLRAVARGMRCDLHGYNRALNRREEAIATLEAFLGEVDAVLCPVATCVAYPGRPMGPWARPPVMEVAGQRLPYLEASIGLTVPFSVTGSPVAVLPAGVVDGLPVGVQVVGRRWGEAALLDVAARLEPLLGGFRPPPLCGG
ncbi:amidase [Zoogloea sp.]|uniref:amidase n=1 Tax=Zoogloea sp. TaxID=49181 RepID=UPI0031FC8076